MITCHSFCGTFEDLKKENKRWCSTFVNIDGNMLDCMYYKGKQMSMKAKLTCFCVSTDLTFLPPHHVLEVTGGAQITFRTSETSCSFCLSSSFERLESILKASLKLVFQKDQERWWWWICSIWKQWHFKDTSTNNHIIYNCYDHNFNNPVKDSSSYWTLWEYLQTPLFLLISK